MIVDRINQYLSSEGKDIDEAILNEASDLMKLALMRQFGPKRIFPNSLRLSSIGKCLRQQAYNLLGYEPNGKVIDSRAKMVFFQGDLVELSVIQLAKIAGCDISVCGLTQETVYLDEVPGHPDGILTDHGEQYLVEVKSMSSYGFANFEKGALEESYVSQYQSYMKALELHKTIYVALNKDAGVLAERIYHLDQGKVVKIRSDIAYLKNVSRETLPERPYQVNEKKFLPWQCLYCAHWKTCWPQAEQVLVSNAYKLKVN